MLSDFYVNNFVMHITGTYISIYWLLISLCTTVVRNAEPYNDFVLIFCKQ
jgi:hypothetical protein